MTPEATMSRRYADLLCANGCSDRTIHNYLHALKALTRFLGDRLLTQAKSLRPFFLTPRLSCEAPAPIAGTAVLRQLQPLVRRHARPPIQP
jgi:hypothetical protein